MLKRFGTFFAAALFTVAIFSGCDSDQDSVPDPFDNCPTTANATQIDSDLDGFGDACDNCPNEANADQTDADGDGDGAACDDNDNNPFD